MNGRNLAGADRTFRTASCGAANIPVPTLSDLSLLVLMGMVAAAAWWHRRVRRNT
jgi:hypothetical protein